ncbi:MAG TPA: hypothetical protein VMT75_08565 [Candidatus Saccharimonadales bacterium]|nr:hypothetical protein [Candidatus Saccharimonadales bacterium]
MQGVLFGFCRASVIFFAMENPRPRSAGVTAAATFAILGSISALAVWGYFLLAIVNAPVDEQGHHLYDIQITAFLIFVLLPPLVLAALIRTAIGLLQLKPWARIIAMIFAVSALMASLWLIAFRPFETFIIPEHFVHDLYLLRQLFAISFVLMLLPASVWWLILFRMNGVKAQFGIKTDEESAKRVASGAKNAMDAHKAVI